MDINKIDLLLKKFNQERDWEKFHSPKNLIMALTGEIGELNEVFQWKTEEESLNLSPQELIQVSDEIADIAIYLLILKSALNIDLEQAILNKIIKNKEKYSPLH